MGETIGRIERIVRYPIKSAGGEELVQARISPRGIEGDREYMIVRAVPDADGVSHFITQRDRRDDADVPQGLSVLSQIQPRSNEDGLVLAWKGTDFHYVPADKKGAEIPVRVWDDTVQAMDMGKHVSDWLSERLNLRVRLVKAAGSFARKARQNYEISDNGINFSDGYPLHLITRTSLNELSWKAGTEVPWHAFRPNIEMYGGDPRIEHVIAKGTLGGVPFTNPKPCDRCVTTNVDQTTGEVIPNRVTEHLAQYMRWKPPEGGVKLIFGTNLNPKGEGDIAVGDEIIMTERRDPPLEYR